MTRKDFFLSAIFFFIGIFSRLLLIPKMQSHPDSPSFSLALVHYSFAQETPAPPGYPLYFGLAKVIMFFAGDPHLSLILLSVLFSGIGAVVFYLIGKSFVNRTVGVVSASLFLSAPTYYFFGLTIYPYLVVAVMMVIVVWCIHEIKFKKKRYGILLGFLYAVYLGVRPQELLLTFPLFLYGFFHLPSFERIRLLITFSYLSLLWFIPFLSITGGLQQYLSSSSRAASAAIPPPSATLFITKRFELGSGLYLTFGAGLIVLSIFLLQMFYHFVKKRSLSSKEKKYIFFFSVWFLPTILFNFFFRTEHAGYQTGYLTFLLFTLAFAVWKLCKGRGMTVSLVTFFIIALNLSLFFYDRDPGYIRPYRQTSFHYSDLVRNDYVLSKKINYIKKNYSPEKTIIVIGPVFWKQAMYYLPDYQVYEIDGLFTKNSDLKNVRRDSKSWLYKEYVSRNFSFDVPPLVDSIVLFDDESKYWVNGSKKIVQFKGRTVLTVVPVKTGDKVSYGLGTIKVISKNETPT